jgi:peptidoglycan/LPS O-acetylase OafA/YrhL
MAAILIAFPLIVWLGISSEVTSRAGQRLCKWLGDISYPLYIVHYPFIYLFIAWEVDNELPFSQAWPGAVGVMVVSVAIASLATRFYDIPVRRWLSMFLTKGAVSTKSSNK